MMCASVCLTITHIFFGQNGRVRKLRRASVLIRRLEIWLCSLHSADALSALRGCALCTPRMRSLHSAISRAVRVKKNGGIRGQCVDDLTLGYLFHAAHAPQDLARRRQLLHIFVYGETSAVGRHDGAVPEPIIETVDDRTIQNPSVETWLGDHILFGPAHLFFRVYDLMPLNSRVLACRSQNRRECISAQHYASVCTLFGMIEVWSSPLLTNSRFNFRHNAMTQSRFIRRTLQFMKSFSFSAFRHATFLTKDAFSAF